MIFIRFENEFNFEYDIQALVRGFYPGESLKTIMPGDTAEAGDESYRFILSFCYLLGERDSVRITVWDSSGKLMQRETATDYSDRVETKNILKRLLYDVLVEITGKTLPWGTLSGIRPTKITSRLLEDGVDKETAFKHMKDTYYISDVKAELSLKISENEMNIFKDIEYKQG